MTQANRVTGLQIDRRTFLKGAGALAAALAMEIHFGGLEQIAAASATPRAPLTTEDLQIFHSFCPGQGLCTASCPLNVTVGGSHINTIFNPPGYHSCVKGRALRMSIYHPDRLKQPMVRVGERGAGEFERITWDDALDLYANRIKEMLNKYGGESILWYPSRGTWGLTREAPKRLFPNVLGGLLTTWGSLCIANKIAAAQTMYGTSSTESDLDTIKDSKLAIIWGYGFADSNRRGDFAGEAMRILLDAQAQGTRIVVIDPFLSQTGSKADQWIPIKPGTDCALALALANVIIDRKLHNQEFIDKHVLGFDAFQEHVKPCTPQWAEPITGVPADVITKLAVDYATEQPAALFPGDGPSRGGKDPSQWVRACGALSAIVGSLGKPGTNATSGVAFAKGIDVTPLVAADQNKVTLKVNECQIADAILTGKALQPSGEVADCNIRMIIFTGSGYVSQGGDTNKTVQALKSPDLEYIIVADHFMTPTAKFADLLLPATMPFERNDCIYYGSAGHALVYGEQCVEPMGQCRSDLEVWAEVAKRLGVGEAFHADWSDLQWIEETLKVQTAPHLKEITLEKLQQEHVIFVGPRPFIPFQEQVNEDKPFPTPSGKIELYAQSLEEQGLPALPTYLDDFENERHPLAAQYPLTLCTPHYAPWLHSSRYNNLWLQQIYTPEVFIHPDDASARQIEDGDAVIVYNGRGATRRTAKVSLRVPTGVLALPQGPWFSPGSGGVDLGGSVNVLTNDSIDRVGGSGLYNSVLVEVKKA